MEQPLDYNSQGSIVPFDAQSNCNYEQDGHPSTMEQQIDDNSQASIVLFNAQNNCNYEQDGYPCTMEQSLDHYYFEVTRPNDYDYEQDLRDYFNSFPPGYRFRPTDEELIVHYLTPKLRKQFLPFNRIPEVRLYEDSPETLTARHEKSGDKDWYFFTSRDKKYPKGSRPKRSAGDGYWKATGADKDIETVVNGAKTKIGSKKSLVYYRGKPPHGTKTSWIMHEFRVHEDVQRNIIHPPDADPMLLDEVVLCRIYNKNGYEDDPIGTNEGEVPSAPPAVVQPPIPVVISDPPVVGQLESAAEYPNYGVHHCSDESSDDPFMNYFFGSPIRSENINDLRGDPIFPDDLN